MSRQMTPSEEVMEASRDRAKKSDHGGVGAAGHVQEGMDKTIRSLTGDDYEEIVSIPEGCTDCLYVGLSWNNVVQIRAEGFLNSLVKKMKKEGVDLDLGCLYELKDGNRGAIQAFGNLYGQFDQAPYIHHSGDEKTGDKEGYDEMMRINPLHWGKVKRLLVYCYIYKGPTLWEQVAPEVSVQIGQTEKKTFQLTAGRDDLPICALVSLENHRGQIKITQHGEYFRGHPAMDRAFGFGLRWEDGEKR